MGLLDGFFEEAAPVGAETAPMGAKAILGADAAAEDALLDLCVLMADLIGFLALENFCLETMVSMC